ncbi:alanine racemase C-terminal domain-containing protein [Pseudolysinimonas sp.]|uniref:alanine racemase C-terminal domain-containing protein n=1 Tax=Pseudolysinimonas sp. TaxID=2680009 RepID=UPI00326322F2
MAPVALEAGVRGVVVSDERDAAVAVACGFSSKMVIIDRDGAGAASRAYGLDGVGIAVMSVIGEVVAVKSVAEGAGVSYGYTYRTASATQLALVALGYADGVPRLASNRAQVMVGGGRYPLVGRVAMDQFVVDCGDDVPELGSDAVLFGDPSRGEPSALDWAEWTERDALALTAGIASRVNRVAR